MRQILLLLCAALPVLGQPLPFAWPDQPQGTLLYVSMPFQYGGASVPGLPGELIVAWSDMRDGQGRVMLQKVDTEHPDDPGRWESELPGWGHVDALAGPVCAGAPFQPQLASDGQGGAIVLWQDANSIFGSELRVLRVGDGADGAGHPLWPADLLLDDNMPVPEEGCRDFSARCRSDADPYKALCADGFGGAWVVWRSQANAWFAQHLTPEGTLDPDFPAEGLGLPVNPSSIRLIDDGAGNAVLIYSAYDTSMDRYHVHALGVRQDGTFLLPQPVQVSPNADNALRFACRPAGEGRTLVSWISYGTWEVRAQLLDAGLLPLWAPEGVFLQLAVDSYNIHCAAAGPQGPFLVSHEAGLQWLGHKLDADGHELWEAPARMDLFDGDSPDAVVALEICNGQPTYLLSHDPDLHVQRLTEEGAPVWPIAQTRLNAEGRGSYYWALNPDGRDGVFGAWLDYDSDDRQIRVQHRDATGQDLYAPAASSLASEDGEVSYSSLLLAGRDDALVAWTRGDSLFAQSVQGSTGARRWELAGRGLDRTYWGVPASVPVEDGAWVLNYVPRVPDGAQFLRIGRLDGDAQPLLPWQDVVPGTADMPDFYGHDSAQLVVNGDRVYVLFKEWGSQGTVKCQAFTTAGERLWGEDGLIVYSAASWTFMLDHATAAVDGGLDLTWTFFQDGVSRGYLQHLTPVGEVAYPDNEGRGRLVNIPLSIFAQNLDLLSLPDGSRVFWAVAGDNSLSILAQSANGETQWSHRMDDVYITGAKLSLDEDGDLLLGWSRSDYAVSSFILQRLLPTGELERTWHSPATPYAYPDDWCLVRGSEQTALVAACNRTDYLPGLQMRGYLLEEGQDEMQTLFDAPLSTALNDMNSTSLAAAPGGDAWLTWQEERGSYFGYGMQARLTRLDVLDLNTAVGEPTRPTALRLAQNQPNPFNPDTWIAFELAQARLARLEVFNLAGQRVRVLQDGPLPAGSHRLRFDALDDAGRPLASGLYLYRLAAASESRTARMLLLR